MMIPEILNPLNLGRNIPAMNRGLLVTLMIAASRAAFAAYEPTLAETQYPTPLPMTSGPFQPTWESLAKYQTPEWFRDAKFGIWAHWGPQSAPEQGDWFGKRMYWQYNKQRDGSRIPNPRWLWFTQNVGPLSEFGFKDVIRAWKADAFDPDRMVSLAKRAGARYFFAMANHHDNFDMWDSKYQPWNSVRIGPKKDLIAGWARAARAAGLRFGVSVHAAHAWSWYEPARDSDVDGPHAGKPYDGNLTVADGKGTWWDGLDPQDLYAQNHPKSNAPWGWKSAPKPGQPRDPAFPAEPHITKFYNRTLDLVTKFNPDILYFDDSVLPFYPWSDVGLKIAADYYNRSARAHGGKVDVVLQGKKLEGIQKRALVLDIERGKSAAVLPEPWQTDTCLGDWHYLRSLYEKNRYKKFNEVAQSLVDIVSKNGNLLLSVPVRGDGSLDDLCVKFLEEMGAWMDVNQEGIIATRPWRVSGEGPSVEADTRIDLGTGEVKEKRGTALTAKDIRFTASKDGRTLYAFLMDWPSDPQLTIRSITSADKVKAVALLGSASPIDWKQHPDGLALTLPAARPGPGPAAVKITFAR